MNSFKEIEKTDPEIAAIIKNEITRQRNRLVLIASENYASKAVLEALGSPLTNKYAEGYPSKRWYSGCEFVDEIESIAIARAKSLFKAEHANVQPHSGAQANMAVLFAMLNPGDAILGMDLSHGGHLSHGMSKNLSGKYYKAYTYQVDPVTKLLDYDMIRQKAKQCKPKMIIVGASAYSRIIDFKAFRDIADETGAMLLADIAHIAGLVATGLHPNPVPYADFVTSTSHKTLRGPRGGFILCKANYAKLIDSAVFPGIQGGPLMHVVAAKAVCFKEAMTETFREYQKQVILNASTLASELAAKGFNIVSGGTDNHLMLVDLENIGMTGKEAQAALSSVSISLNKNTIPYDKNNSYICGGIRIGTPAVTTRGMVQSDMVEIASLIALGLKGSGSEKEEVASRVHKLCETYPLYEGL